MIRFGHSWSEIQDYSLAQIQAFLEAATTIELEERRNTLVERAISASGDGKAVKKALKQLEP